MGTSTQNIRHVASDADWNLAQSILGSSPLALAHIRLYSTPTSKKSKPPSSWTFQQEGICALWAKQKPASKIRFVLFNPDNGRKLWTQKLYVGFEYIVEQSLFHTFEADKSVVAFVFGSEDAASKLASAIKALNIRSIQDSKIKKQSISNNNGFIIDKSMIGAPQEFRHISGIQVAQDGGFAMGNIPQEWEDAILAAGITAEQLRDKRTRRFIFKALQNNSSKDLELKSNDHADSSVEKLNVASPISNYNRKQPPPINTQNSQVPLPPARAIRPPPPPPPTNQSKQPRQTTTAPIAPSKPPQNLTPTANRVNSPRPAEIRQRAQPPPPPKPLQQNIKIQPKPQSAIPPPPPPPPKLPKDIGNSTTKSPQNTGLTSPVGGSNALLDSIRNIKRDQVLKTKVSDLAPAAPVAPTTGLAAMLVGAMQQRRNRVEDDSSDDDSDDSSENFW